MRGFHMTAMTAGLVGGAMLLFGAAPASAVTLSGSAFAPAGETSMVEQVRYHEDRRAGKYDRRYDKRRHGKRHKRYRSGYRHHHRGHYYASPWWLAAPSIGFGVTIGPRVHAPSYGYSGRRSRHVQWCHNRFRSYNAATDSYLGYDGRYHRCNSPY